MDAQWLWRMKRWLQNPPSKKTIRIVLVVFLICFALWLIEYLGFVPDDLRPQSTKMPPIK